MALTDYKAALVTGASSGIGEATVRALSERGIQVYAAARRKEKLDLLASETGFIPVVLDVQDKDAIYSTLNDLKIDIRSIMQALVKVFRPYLKPIQTKYKLH